MKHNDSILIIEDNIYGKTWNTYFKFYKFAKLYRYRNNNKQIFETEGDI